MNQTSASYNDALRKMEQEREAKRGSNQIWAFGVSGRKTSRRSGKTGSGSSARQGNGR